jgi:hypothetical protein
MRKTFSLLPLLALVSACSDNGSLENKGQQAGAAADNAIERVGAEIEASQKELENRAADVGEKVSDVKQDVKQGVSKAENAVDAAAAELKK